MADSKIYVPGLSLKTFKFPTGGAKLSVGIHVEKLIAFLNEHKNDRGYVNLDIVSRKQPSPYGETHTATLNTWKPKPKQEAATEAPDIAPSGANPDNPDDLPF